MAAKRSYHDAHGYKHKRRKRGTPQFSTIAEMDAHTYALRKETRSKNPIVAAPPASSPALDALEQLAAKLPKEDPEDPIV